MYHAKLWDEDKWNIHSKGYGSSKYSNMPGDGKKDDKEYHEQKYGQKDENASSDYMRKEEHKEKDEKKDDFLESEEEKEKNELKEEDIPFKAAKQVFSENKAKPRAEKKDITSIDDAIKKAIEQEKKVIMMD